MRRALASVSVLGLMLAAAGCGGGGGERLTKAEFATQANAICNDFNEELEGLGEPKSLEELAELADKAIPIFEAGLGDLRDLNPPEEIEAAVDEWLDTGDEALERSKRLRDAAKDGDEAEVRRIGQEVSEAEPKSDALARAVGATTCAEN